MSDERMIRNDGSRTAGQQVLYFDRGGFLLLVYETYHYLLAMTRQSVEGLQTRYTWDAFCAYRD